ncbi:MAG: zf-TFIIB domain-containing protein [Oligoflexales bacterium]|nr:zf-TFIIB domain-containing protein [Oligoflexales bacterium]
MKEVNLKGIMIDKCTNCHGIYFDQGELETLLQSEQQKRFFSIFMK